MGGGLRTAPHGNISYNGVQMPTTVFLFDAESGQLRARIPIPDVPAGYPAVASLAPAPPLAFDAESHLLAVATTKSLSLFSVPDGTPLISEALPELGNRPRSTGAMQAPDLHDAHRPPLRPGDKPVVRDRPSVGPWAVPPSAITIGPGQARRAGRLVLGRDPPQDQDRRPPP